MAIPPPPQVCGAVQAPQVSVPRQPFGIVPQFLPCAAQVVGVHRARAASGAMRRMMSDRGKRRRGVMGGSVRKRRLLLLSYRSDGTRRSAKRKLYGLSRIPLGTFRPPPRRRSPEARYGATGGVVGRDRGRYPLCGAYLLLSRNGSTPPPLERGRKDTIVIGGDRGDVKILLPFPANFHTVPRPVSGRFVFHCHNIEHEDMRMMAQFDIQP